MNEISRFMWLLLTIFCLTAGATYWVKGNDIYALGLSLVGLFAVGVSSILGAIERNKR